MNRLFSKSGRVMTITTVASETPETTWYDYIKFAVFVVMLLVPLYAIVHSAVNHNWIMMVTDALFVPVGFVHGVLLLFGLVG